MDWGSIAIGLGGLLLAAFTTYLSYQQHKDDRKSKYRESLYSKQIELSQNVIKGANEYLNLVRRLLVYGVDTETVSKEIAKAVELDQQLNEKYSEYIIFVTNRLHKAFKAYINVCHEATQYISSVSIKNTSGDRGNVSAEIQVLKAQLRNAYYELVESMREIVGTEYLSDETLSLIKK